MTSHKHTNKFMHTLLSLSTEFRALTLKFIIEKREKGEKYEQAKKFVPDGDLRILTRSYKRIRDSLLSRTRN